MRAVQQWWRDLSQVAKHTGRIWWRCLPSLLAVHAAGWLIYRLALMAAAALSGTTAWLALLFLAAGLVARLAAIIVSLRLIGSELGVDKLLETSPLRDTADDPGQLSLSALLAMTLLPFVGIYAIFGKIEEASNDLVVYEIVMRGFLAPSVLSELNPQNGRDVAVIVAVLVLTYVVRRSVDLLHDRLRLGILGLVAALLEAFLMLIVLLAGTRLIGRMIRWFQDRAAVGWLEDAWASVASVLAKIWVALPDLITGFVGLLTDTIWPLVIKGAFEPALWLAVAALTYGTHVLSLAEMWRKGEPLSIHLDETHYLHSRRLARRRGADSSVARRLWLEIQEAFFSDVDDKYLPTFQSLRLIFNVGVVFLGGYVLLYALIVSLQRVLWNLLRFVIGGQESRIWVALEPAADLVVNSVVEPLRYTLLAVAFVYAVQVVRGRAHPSALEPAVEPMRGLP